MSNILLCVMSINKCNAYCKIRCYTSEQHVAIMYVCMDIGSNKMSSKYSLK